MAIGLTVSQSAALSPILATDTSTGIGVTSRHLLVYDSNGTLVTDYNMGTNLTQNVPIVKDVFYTFILTLNGSISTTKTYLSTRQVDLQSLTLEQALNCGCSSSKSLCNDAVKSLLSESWANTYWLFNQGSNSQRCIDAANTLIATTSPCNC